MKTRIFFSICFFIVVLSTGKAQDFKVHSHNDYKQNFPFWKAIGAEVNSIEVDIFLQNGKLLVAHELSDVEDNKTLQRMYLEPLKEVLELGLFSNKPLQLLIDVKSDAYKTLDVIIDVLKAYPMITANTDIEIVISGNRPKLSEYIQYPGLFIQLPKHMSLINHSGFGQLQILNLLGKFLPIWA